MKQLLDQTMTQLRHEIKGDTEAIVKTEIAKLSEECKQRYVEQKKEIDDLKAKMQKQNKVIDSIARANNLVFFGVTLENENVTALENKVVDICKNMIKVPLELSDLNKVIRIGKKGAINNPILVSFLSNIKRFQILKNSSNLKASGITVSADLSKEEREQRKFLSQCSRQLKEKSHACIMKRNGLVVNGKFWSIEQLKDNIHEVEKMDVTEEKATTSAEDDVTDAEVDEVRKRKRMEKKQDKVNKEKRDLRSFFRGSSET